MSANAQRVRGPCKLLDTQHTRKQLMRPHCTHPLTNHGCTGGCRTCAQATHHIQSHPTHDTTSTQHQQSSLLWPELAPSSLGHMHIASHHRLHPGTTYTLLVHPRNQSSTPPQPALTSCPSPGRCRLRRRAAAGSEAQSHHPAQSRWRGWASARPHSPACWLRH